MEERYIKVKDEKYLVFRRVTDPAGIGEQIHDAVVIRKQDVFAPPALEAYANAIQCVIQTLRSIDNGMQQSWSNDTLRNLQKIVDYFHAQAEDAYDMERKLPD